LNSTAKPVPAKPVGVPPWTEQLAEFGSALWQDLPNHADELLAAMVLLLAFSVFAATL
jgi:hypothetical protein